MGSASSDEPPDPGLTESVQGESRRRGSSLPHATLHRLHGATFSPGDAWQWPEWCFQRRPPVIEVFVIDDATGRTGWVNAMPKERIRDPNGDTYLCAEYDWGGEIFVEDFGPDRVRRRGDVVTALDAGERRESRGADADFAACAVCCDLPGDVILVPCSHGGICGTCAARILQNRASGGARCPQCRTDIERFVRAERPRRPPPPPPPPPIVEDWTFPAWCFKKEKPVVEVFAVDDVACKGQWVSATPKARVVHNQDQYLCAEYFWDGARFVEDFGPERIRQCGEALTLAQQLLLETHTAPGSALDRLVHQQKELEERLRGFARSGRLRSATFTGPERCREAFREAARTPTGPSSPCAAVCGRRSCGWIPAMT